MNEVLKTSSSKILSKEQRLASPPCLVKITTPKASCSIDFQLSARDSVKKKTCLTKEELGTRWRSLISLDLVWRKKNVENKRPPDLVKYYHAHFLMAVISMRIASIYCGEFSFS